MSKDLKKESSQQAIDQTLEAQKSIIERLNQSQAKIQQKIEYYQSFIENIAQFPNSQKVFQAKSFIQTNVKNYDGILENLYRVKEEFDVERYNHNELRLNLNQVLKNAQNCGLTIDNDEVTSLSEKLGKMENQAKSLEQEIALINEKNKKIYSTLSKKDFFNEYEMFMREVEGLRKQNSNLKEKLRIKEASTNPSN